VPLPADPDRIVSLSAASTEDLFAVGAGRQVVAADEYSTYPPDAPRTTLNGFEPNVEAIAKYRPDLVVISQRVDQIEPQLAALRIPVLYEPAPNNLAGAYAQIAQLGGATGHARQAGLVIAEMQRQVAAIVASVSRQNPPLSVYHELDQTYYSASSQTFIGQLYALLGLRNIADEAAKAAVYPQLTSEYIVASNPDLIVLADTVCCGQSRRTVAARPGWRNIAAVRDQAVLAVNDSVASEWGPRVVLFLAAVAGEVKRIQSQR
jgi:iron complex transport system substrate-binding protein